MSEDHLKELQGQLIDLAIEDRVGAGALLERHPELLRSKAHLGETALHFCIVENFLEAARYLLEKGAPPDEAAARHSGWPLRDAAILGNVQAIRLLLEFGADANKPGPLGTALDAAVEHRQEECVEILRAFMESGKE